MEEIAVFRDHQVLEMPVTDRQQVSCHSITCTRPQIGLQNLLLLGRIRIQRCQVCMQVSVAELLSHCYGLGWHKFENTVIWACCQYFEWCELEIVVDLLEQVVHDCNHVVHQRILTGVITVLENNAVSVKFRHALFASFISVT
jgi:hypothetical protein